MAIELSDFTAMKDQIWPLLTNGYPAVRHGAVRFIDGLIRSTDQQMLKEIVPILVPKLVPLIGDKDLPVGDAAIHTLGVLKGSLTGDE